MREIRRQSVPIVTVLPSITVLLLTLGAAGCAGADGVPEEPRASGQAGREAAGQAGQEVGEQAGGTEPGAETGEPGIVELDAERVAELGIQTGTPRLGSAREVIERPATVSFDLDRLAKVGPRIEAKVVRVTRDFGDRVTEGEPLALMSSVELGLAKAGYLATAARLETDRRAYGRERDLQVDRISSEAEMLEARAAFEKTRADLDAARETLRLYGLSDAAIEAVQPEPEMPLSRFWLRSPLAGVVQRRDVSPGDSVGPQETPFHVVEASSVWVMIDAFERDAGLLRTGQEVELSVRSLPERTFTGQLDWVSLELDEETRTVRARAVVDNAELGLRSGMFGSARIHVPEAVAAPMVPVDAIQTVGGERVVFVPVPEGFEAVAVRLGEESGGWAEVVAGLGAEQQVVTAGAFHLMSALTAHQREVGH